MEEIMEDNQHKKKMVYKTIKMQGREFTVRGNPEEGEKPELVYGPFDGATRVTLDPTYARFLEGNYDIVVDANSNVVESPAAKFARVSELVMGLSSNPLFARWFDGEKSVKGLLHLANLQPKDWMAGNGMTEGDMRALAEMENGMFLRMAETGKIWMLPGTPGATEAHTEEHLNFAQSATFEKLPQEVQDVVTNHIAEEHEKNPNTGSMADKLKQVEGGGAPSPDAAGPAGTPTGGDVITPGAPGGPAVPAMPVDGGTSNGGDVTAGNQQNIA
jgi:hypothetical protein